MDPGRVGAVVLAAGQSSRFGSPKHLAPLGGRPLLAHVLDALASAGLGEIVVVLGHAADDVEPIVTVPSARIVRNPDPDAGLSSSLAVGIAALAPWVEAALVVLGDQPLLRPGTIRALVAAPEPVGTRSRSHPARATLPGRATRPTRTTPPGPATLRAGPTLPGRATRPTRATPPAAAAIAFVPAYAGGGSPNPVLLLRAGWSLVGEASGDQGLGPLLRARPELTREVPVEGSNPDVDTPGDLLALAWAERVRADREQVDRVREVPDDADFYGPIVGRFVEDPRRTGDAALDALLSLVEPGETWLDIGAGAGRYALPIALRAGEVIALDLSPGMLASLREAMARDGIGNLRIVQGRWPLPPAQRPHADVALIANVGYDIEAIAEFLDAMEASANRLCAAVLLDRQPSALAERFWPPIHGEQRVRLPALHEFVELLTARGTRPDVTLVERPPRGFRDEAALLEFVRRQLWIAPGGERERRLAELVHREAVELPGGVGLSESDRAVQGIVRWKPRRRSA